VTTFFRKDKKKVSAGGFKAPPSVRSKGPTWSPPWVNQVSGQDPFAATGGSRKTHRPDAMSPKQIDQRKSELQRMALVPGRKILAENVEGKKHLGLFSREDPKTGYFYMKGSKDRFDPRGSEVEIRLDDLVTFKGEKPIYRVLDLDKGRAKLNHREGWVSVSDLRYLRPRIPSRQVERSAGK